MIRVGILVKEGEGGLGLFEGPAKVIEVIPQPGREADVDYRAIAPWNRIKLRVLATNEEYTVAEDRLVKVSE